MSSTTRARTGSVRFADMAQMYIVERRSNNVAPHETEAGLVADFSRWADDISEIDSSNKKTGYLPDFGPMSFVFSNNLSMKVKALPDAIPTATVAVECKKKTTPRRQSFGCELKRTTARSLTTELNRSHGSTHKSASVPVISASTWTKQEQETSPPTKRARTWQEIASEINRFAEENMRNAGWEDLWAYKKKAGEVDESLSYLTTQSLRAIRKAEVAFQESMESQQKLQAWDKMMGLKGCHSRTMAKSSVTRKKIQKEMTEINEGQVNCDADPKS